MLDFQKPFMHEVDISAVVLRENAHGTEHCVCVSSLMFIRHQMNFRSIAKEVFGLSITLEDFWLDVVLSQS